MRAWCFPIIWPKEGLIVLYLMLRERVLGFVLVIDMRKFFFQMSLLERGA